MKAWDYFRLLAVLLISQVALTIFLTVLVNKGPTTLDMSSFKCSCFQNNGDGEQVIFAPETPIQKEDAKEFKRNNLNRNFTIISTLNGKSARYANGWLESLRRLRIPCRVKLVSEDGGIEPHLKSKIERGLYGDTMNVEVIPIKAELNKLPRLPFWNQLFKIFVDELLQEHDVLYVDVQSLWLNNPMPLIWKNYGSFDMWTSKEADRSKIDTRFIFLKSALLNLRLINEWEAFLSGQSVVSSDSGKICFQKSVEKFIITHKFRVVKFDFAKFPVRKEYTSQWIQLNKDDVYVIYGTNLEDVDLMRGDTISEEGVERKITDENTGLQDSFNLKRKNVTILAVTNSGFLDFTKNWLQSLLILNETFHVKLLTQDEKSFAALRKVAFHLRYSKLNVSVESERNSTDKALKFSSKAYFNFVNTRPQSVLREMMNGQDVLFVDVDTVWLKDPLPLIWSQYAMYDVFVATGYDNKTPCPCFLYLKNSMLNIRLVNDWLKRLERVNKSPVKAKHENDMNALDKILYKYTTKYKTKVHKLNSIQFPTGDMYFKTPNFYDNHKKEVYVVHGNKLGKHGNKLFFFKLLRLWYADNWDYRNSPIVGTD